MATYSVPGVYVQEVSTLPPSVAAVDTAVPAFVGYTEKGPDTPVRITSLLEYQQIFGGPEVYDTANQIGIAASSTDEITGVTIDYKFQLYYSLQAYYANGGGTAYIVSVGNYDAASIDDQALKDGIDLLASEDEPTLIVVPDATGIGTDADIAAVYAQALEQCNKLKDRFTIIDFFPPTIATNVADAAEDFRTAMATNYGLYSATYFPSLKTVYNFSYTNSGVKITGGTYDNKTLAELLAMSTPPTEFITAVKAAIAAQPVVVNPSGFAAGVYAATDANRGVWKAPANVALNDIVGPTYKLTDDDQAILNVDTTAGKSVNAIRTFTGKGTLVWGARTMDSNSLEWRYINVRRLFIFVEESLQKATGAFVFEPNSAQTWTRVKGMIENFLTGLWRQGALVGAKPADAFYVNVGLGTTMTAEDILQGVMNIEIGMAAARPAEFIVLKFSHKMQVS